MRDKIRMYFLCGLEIRYCNICKSVKPDRAHHCSICGRLVMILLLLLLSDVKSSKPDCPRGQNFVLGLDNLSSASSSSSGIWPRHVLRLCNLALSICVFHDKAQANDLHSTIHPMPSQYIFTIYSHFLGLVLRSLASINIIATTASM